MRLPRLPNPRNKLSNKRETARTALPCALFASFCLFQRSRGGAAAPAVNVGRAALRAP